MFGPNNVTIPDNTKLSILKNSSIPETLPLDSTDNRINLMYTNIRSLVPKLHHLNNYIHVAIHEPAVVGITETWLDASIPSSFFCPPNYEVFRKDRRHSRGGGSLLMIGSALISKSVDILSTSCTRVDAIACQVALANNQSLGCLCVYRPPNTPRDEDIALCNILTKFLSYKFDYNIIMEILIFLIFVGLFPQYHFRVKLFLLFAKKTSYSSM